VQSRPGRCFNGASNPKPTIETEPAINPLAIETRASMLFDATMNNSSRWPRRTTS